ncbi:MAG: TolB family protein [Candidatus Bipolaricaulaceae bacterium]
MRRGIIGGLVALAVGVQAGWAVPGFHPAVAELRGSSGAGHPDFALFLEEVGGQPELWFCSLDGESWKMASGVAATDAAFSPHGHYLAYIRRLPGPPADTKEAGRCPYPHQLWVARVDGSESRLVLEFPAVGRLQCPGEVGWSPDGERIYFGVAGSPTHREVWSVNKDGSDLRNHTWGWDFTVHPGGQISGITRGWIPFIYDPAGGDKVYVTDWGMIYHAFF